MRSGEGTTICWEGAQQASPALLIHSPFFREELEMREDKMLLGGCVYFESASKLSVFPCSLQGQLCIGVAEFPQVVVATMSAFPHIQTRSGGYLKSRM